jgi:endonuclease/exonuclease/phosphatase (EEP) superfamily protein YafD
MDDAAAEETPPLKDAPMPARSAIVAWFLGLIVLGVVGLSAIGLAGRVGWLADLCTHFRFQYALVLLVTTIGLALLRSRRMFWVSLAGLMLNTGFVMPLYLGGPEPGELNKSPLGLKVLHLNAHTANTNYTGVIDLIQDETPDVVFLQEVNRLWLEAMDNGLAGYRRVAAEGRTDNFGIACYAKEPSEPGERAGQRLVIESSRVFDPTQGVAQVPAIELLGRFNDKPVAILSVHPLPPVSGEYARARNATLRAAGEWSAARDEPCIIVGDFNATPWSTAFRDLQSAGDLVNSQNGFGRAPTWPAGFASLGMIPIDHLLHSDALLTVDRRVGEVAGSDHLPLIVDLRWDELE